MLLNFVECVQQATTPVTTMNPQHATDAQPQPQPQPSPVTAITSLDPYGLLGVTVDSTPGQVRRAYYDLSRLVHPDKGGNAADMNVVHCAYKYVRDQVSGVNRTVSIEDLEERFAAFCRDQMEEPVPSMCRIANDEGIACSKERVLASTIASFHRMFEALPVTGQGRASHHDGYDIMMEHSEYHVPGALGPVAPVTFVPYCLKKSSRSAHRGQPPESSVYSPFETDIIAYHEPMTASTDTTMAFSEMVLSKGLDDYGTNRPFEMTDYRTAFTTTHEPLPEVTQFQLCQTWEQHATNRMLETVNYWCTPVG